MIFLHVCFFFFSSRRRHTRLQGDWSSDVCSSDLSSSRGTRARCAGARRARVPREEDHVGKIGTVRVVVVDSPRSEERRVGKECRSRRGTYDKTIRKSEKKSKRETRLEIVSGRMAI